MATSNNGDRDDDREPNALSDVARGLGLLLRAARTAARKLPKKDLEEAVVSSAREVGRAIENVAGTIERSVIKGARGEWTGVKDEWTGQRKPPPAGGAGGDAEEPRRDETEPHKRDRRG